MLCLVRCRVYREVCDINFELYIEWSAIMTICRPLIEHIVTLSRCFSRCSILGIAMEPALCEGETLIETFTIVALRLRLVQADSKRGLVG